MNIVHTEASCGWGGQEIRILEESRGLIERGHAVCVLCPPESRIFEEGPKRGVPTIALPIGRKNLKGLFALRRWLKQNPVDVINTHSSTDSWLIAMRPGTRRTLPNTLLGQILEKVKHAQARIRAKVEHPFRIVKRKFEYLKTRYSGMAKNSAQIVTLFALANLYHARYHLGVIRL